MNKKSKIYLWILLITISLIIRIYLSQFEGYSTDIWYFKTWSRAANINEFQDFYASTNSDYPPFYIYFLWFIGYIYKFFYSNFDINTPEFTILIKIPANIFDIITSFLIYEVVKKYSDFKNTFLITLSYLFNPAIIYNSAIWGQVDSINTLFIILTTYFIVSEKFELGAISMAIAILAKPQSLLILIPFIIFMITILNKKSSIKISKFMNVFISFLGAFITLALPFYVRSLKISDTLIKMVLPYIRGYDKYPFTSLNAFNIWAFAGFWKSDNMPFLFLSYREWAYILFAILFIYVLFNIMKIKNNNIIYFGFAILFFGFFMLSTRMHERYIFPMFALLAIAMSMDKRLVLIFWIMTITFFFNLYYVLNFPHMSLYREYIPIISTINLVMLIYSIYCFSTFKKISYPRKNEAIY